MVTAPTTGTIPGYLHARTSSRIPIWLACLPIRILMSRGLIYLINPHSGPHGSAISDRIPMPVACTYQYPDTISNLLEHVILPLNGQRKRIKSTHLSLSHGPVSLRLSP